MSEALSGREQKFVDRAVAANGEFEQVSLKRLVSKIGSGKTPRGGNETYVSDGVTFLRSQNVHFDGLRLDDVVFLEPETHREMSNTALQPDDVLLNITGGPIFLRIGNVPRHGVDLLLDELQRVDPPTNAEGIRTLVQPGDVLVSITADIGSIGVVPKGLGEAYVNQHVALVRPRRRQVASRFLAYMAC